jgi:hypothetical protein
MADLAKMTLAQLKALRAETVGTVAGTPAARRTRAKRVREIDAELRYRNRRGFSPKDK